MVDVKVEFRGLRELSAAFKAVDADLPKAFRVRLLGVAAMVAGRVQSKVPRLTGRAAASYKPRASTRGAGIAFGGSAAPYVPWLEFGGRVGVGKSIERELVIGGRYLYPTLADSKADIAKAVEDAVEAASRDAGFEVTGF